MQTCYFYLGIYVPQVLSHWKVIRKDLNRYSYVELVGVTALDKMKYLEMKRFIISLIYTLTIIILYQFIDINLFTIDLPRRISSELFKGLRYDQEIDATVLMFDIEYTGLDTVKTQNR
jgi:hypothetical protein